MHLAASLATCSHHASATHCRSNIRSTDMHHRSSHSFFRLCLTLLAIAITSNALLAEPAALVRPFRIEVVDAENGWPVPLVELRTTHNVSFVTDNAGNVAFDLPELMGKPTWLAVKSHGYEVAKDGFGMRGVRITPIAGKSTQIKVSRTIIAKRLGRLTGAGLFAESQKRGLETEWRETGVLGCDSIQTATYKGKHFWLWGDTTLAHYPLGIFHSSSATTSLQPLKSFTPPLRVAFEYFRDKQDKQGKPRGVSKLPGSGPTWLTGYMTLKDRDGNERLVATYTKIKPPLDEYEVGLCVWNDKTEQFDRTRVIWNRDKDADQNSKRPPVPRGHPVRWPVSGNDADGKAWMLIGDPFPTMRFPATFEAWANPESWQIIKPQSQVPIVVDGQRTNQTIKPHRGSVAWSPYRKRWVTIFTQHFGKSSAFGEIWYAEADAPTGPWGPAVKVLSHDNHTFYNPRIHPEFSPHKSESEPSPILLFEGTYTHTFANRAVPTPRYDYNQILYRLDLDDVKLKPAQAKQVDD